LYIEQDEWEFYDYTDEEVEEEKENNKWRNRVKGKGKGKMSTIDEEGTSVEVREVIPMREFTIGSSPSSPTSSSPPMSTTMAEIRAKSRTRPRPVGGVWGSSKRKRGGTLADDEMSDDEG